MVNNREVLFSIVNGQVIVLNNETGRHEVWQEVKLPTDEPVIEYGGISHAYASDTKLQDIPDLPHSFYETLAEKFINEMNVSIDKINEIAQVNLRSAVNDDYQELEDEAYTVHVLTMVGESYGQYTYLAVATAFGTVEENDSGEIDREWGDQEGSMEVLVYDVDIMSGLVADLINEASELKGTFSFMDFEGCGYSLVYTIDVETMVDNGMCPKCGGTDLEIIYDSVPYGSTNAQLPSGVKCTDCGEEY